MKRVARELAEKNKTDLARAQDWTSGGSDLFYGKGNKNHHLGTFFFLYIRQLHLHLGEFVSDKISHTVSRGHWCDALYKYTCPN